MMQDGLHIGLAAWINEQGQAAGFVVYPGSPIPTALVHLEAIQNVYDLAKAAEFAALVNFIPRQGLVAEAFSASAVLWRMHRDILGQMDHATEPWRTEEQAEYQAALDVLYTSDSSGVPVPSQRHLLYEEMRQAYQDVKNSGGAAEEIAQALANWLVLGYKSEIENAFELMRRLSGRSSRSQAEREAMSLTEDPPGVGLRFYGDMAFAPVYFAPISATTLDTWMGANVSFDDLERAVVNKEANGKWRSYRANRNGEVLFDYVVLKCMRPWYTPRIYQADDWKLRDSGSIVSTGNGTDGRLPAYVDSVFLVNVKNVTTKPMPPPPLPKPQQTLRPFSAVRAELVRPMLQPKSPEISAGVVKRAVNTPMFLRTTSASVRSTSSVRVSGVAAASTVTGIRRLTASDLHLRITLAQARLGGIAARPPAEGTAASQIWVAGFGCEKIPFSPNPNVNYRWT